MARSRPSGNKRPAQRRTDRLAIARAWLDFIYDSRERLVETFNAQGQYLKPATRDAVLLQWVRINLLSRGKSPPQGVRKAFAYFGLNPEIPEHWCLVLLLLADVCFAPGRIGRRKGSGMRWRIVRLLQLHLHFEKVGGKALSDRSAAGLIKTTFPEHYSDTTERQIREHLPAARREHMRAKELLVSLVPLADQQGECCGKKAVV